MASLIINGMLCKQCVRECRDIGSDQTPIEIECPNCDGAGCDKCRQGMVRITGCPNEYCLSIAPLVSLAELFKKGIPPVAGGVLDQSVWFVEAARILDRESAMIERENAKR